MANTKVRGYPTEGPYTQVEIDEGPYTFTFVKLSDGRIIQSLVVKHDTRQQMDGYAAKEYANKARKQAIAVIKSSEKRAQKSR